MSPTTKVQIYNQTYSLQGDLDQAYLEELAGFVDAKMQAIARLTSTVDTQRVAVLTALALADELNSLRKEKSDREELMKEQAQRCLTLVERALRQTE